MTDEYDPHTGRFIADDEVASIITALQALKGNGMAQAMTQNIALKWRVNGRKPRIDAIRETGAWMAEMGNALLAVVETMPEHGSGGRVQETDDAPSDVAKAGDSEGLAFLGPCPTCRERLVLRITKNGPVLKKESDVAK